MLDSFVRTLADLRDDEMVAWLTDGLVRYHDSEDAAYRKADLAFEGANFSFGRGQPERRVVNDLLELGRRVSVTSPSRFDRVVSRSIDLISVNSACQQSALRDLIELALESKNSRAIEAVTRKLRVPDANLRRLICLDAVYFLSEGHAQPQMLELGKYMIDHVDFPFEISAHLIVGVASIDPDNAVQYARRVEKKLIQQLETLSKYPEQYREFAQQFGRAVLMAANRSSTVEALLKMQIYGKLLAGQVVLIPPTAHDEMMPDAVTLEPVGFAWKRIWEISDFNSLHPTAKRNLATPQPNRKGTDTQQLIQSCLAVSN